MTKLSKFNMFFPYSQDFDLVYNSLYGTLLLVDRDVSSALRSGELKRLEADSEVFAQLKSQRILIDDDFSEEEHYSRLTREVRFSSKVVSMFLSLTNRCNLACVYCYESYRPNVEGYDMSAKEWEIVRGFLERKINSGSEMLALALYGGEPLLNPAIAKRVTKEIDELVLEYGIRKEVDLITNATVLDGEVEEVVNSVDSVQVTIDGPRDVHNSRRPFKDRTGTFDIVLENTLKFIDKHGKRIGIRVNVDEFNVERSFELIDLLSSLGIQSKVWGIDLSPVHPDQASAYRPFKASSNYREYYSNISRGIVEALEYAVGRGFRISKVFIKGPCICKFSNGYAVDEKLNIYMCPAYMYDKPLGRILGNGLASISPERMAPIINDPECTKSCKYAPICYGGCIYLKSKGASTCLIALYGEHNLERLVRAYAISKYRDVVRDVQ
ncbi:MAG: radical SAM protein [Desulfurococcaceae archaeon]